MKLLRMLCCSCVFFLLAGPVLAAITEQEISIPVTVKGVFGDSQQNMFGHEFRPEGAGPFPLVVINHGTPTFGADNVRVKDAYMPHARLFAQRGFVVINPLRLGFGKSEGVAGDSYGSCDNPSYVHAGLMTARDIAAAIAYAKTKPYIDTSRIILVGQSGGGFGVLALASENPPGVVAVINFAGGRGARGFEQVCSENRLIDAYSEYAKTTHVPMLWFYSENDHSFYAALAQKLYGAYQREGVDVKFVVAPPYGKTGHMFFHDVATASVWMPLVEQFLKKVGVPAITPAVTTPDGVTTAPADAAVAPEPAQ